MFGDFGISTATSKYIAEYRALGHAKEKEVLFTMAAIMSVITLLIAAITLLFGRWYMQDKYAYVLYLLPLLFMAPMTSLYDGIYRGMKQFKRLAIITLSVGAVSIPIVYFLIYTQGLRGALLSQDIFYLLLLVALGFGYREFSLSINKTVMREVGTYSFYIGISVIGYYLFSRIDVLVLGHFGYIREIATFEVLNKLFLVCMLPLQVFAQVIFPDFAEHSAHHDFKTIQSSFRKYVLICAGLAVLFAVAAYFGTPVIIGLFFAKYVNEILFTLLLPVVLISAIQVYGVVLHSGIISATGYAYLMSYLNLILGPINLVLGIFLTIHFGYMGIIYSNLLLNVLGTIILQALFYMRVHKKLITP
jgi:O-antigen/teichoic acid export membrane protein